MNKTKSIQFILVFVLAVALSLSFLLQDAKAYSCGDGSDAATICEDPDPNCDSDMDGYWDDEECDGITLPHATNPSEFVTYSMDPTQKDLFLIIVPSTDASNTYCSGQDTLLPADLLYPSTDPPSVYRLGLTVNTLNVSQAPDQAVGRDQNAIKMTENCSTSNPDVAGEAIRGFPTQGVHGAVFTQVIYDKIFSACPDDTYTCSDGFGVVTADQLVDKHIIHTFNHEVGHMIGLSINYDRKVGYHWKAGTGNELDQFVDCSSNKRKKTATCYVPDIHGLPDIDAVRLKP